MRPSLLEDHGHLPRRRPLDAGVGVSPGPSPGGARSPPVFVGDVHPPRKGDAAIHDENLAMVAEGLSEEMGKERMEEPYIDAHPPRLPPEGAPRRKGPPGVREDPDGHAAGAGAAQKVAKVTAGRVVLPDVRLDEDLALSGPDRRAHRLEGLRPGKVRIDAIAFEEGRLIDPAQERCEPGVPHTLR